VSDRDTVVCVESLVKDYRSGFLLRGKRVLRGVSFRVREGEIFGFVGPNGAGKTTTLKVLMGLIRADAGRATVLGHDVRETEYRNQIGFLPEAPYFYDYLTGREFLHFYARVCGVSRSDRARRVDTLLEWVGLAHAAEARLRTYSKGMLQRIGIAQALVHDPKVVFLDEPMSGLDPIGRKEIRDLIVRLQSEGKTVFMNTHILSDVEMLCHRVAIIVQGEVRYEGDPQAVLGDDERDAEIVLNGVAPAFWESLETRFESGVRGVGDRIEVLLPYKLVDDVIAEAFAAGAHVVSVTPRRATLEDLFLTTVEQGARR